MIFKKYSAFFQPHELDALTAAYVAVWQEVRASDVRASEASVLKNNLAQIILASACTGERDTERLKQIALRAVLSKLRNKQPSMRGEPSARKVCKRPT
jgi:hypothetical protein